MLKNLFKEPSEVVECVRSFSSFRLQKVLEVAHQTGEISAAGGIALIHGGSAVGHDE